MEDALHIFQIPCPREPAPSVSNPGHQAGTSMIPGSMGYQHWQGPLDIRKELPCSHLHL